MGSQPREESAGRWGSWGWAAVTALAGSAELTTDRASHSLRRQVSAINRLAQENFFFWDYGNAFLLEAQRAGEREGRGVPSLQASRAGQCGPRGGSACPFWKLALPGPWSRWASVSPGDAGSAHRGRRGEDGRQ